MCQLTEPVKEQSTMRRQGGWLLPEGRTVGRRVLVHCCGESRAVVLDCK
jgi:hypothetical protein